MFMKTITYLIITCFFTSLCSCSNDSNLISTKYLEFDDQNIEYKVRNPKSKVSCILIHGFGDSYSSFENLFAIFDSLKIKTIYYDLPGMGTNKDINISFDENISVIKELYEAEATNKTFAIGHSMGGLLLLLSSAENNLNFKEIITIEPSITEPDYNFFKYIQEEPIGIGLDSFVNKKRPLVGYTEIYIKNLKNSNIEQLKKYANTVYVKFNENVDYISQCNIKFTYVFGRKSSGLENRKLIGNHINIDTISFNNAQHWVHYDALEDFRKYLINELDK